MAKYTNLDGTTPDKGFADLLKWRFGGTRRPDGDFLTPHRDNDGALLARPTPHLTWIGHATFAMRLAQKMIVTDPIFSERIQGVVRRKTPPGVALEKMPPIDVVTVSHTHYDHLDMPSLKRIGKAPLYIVPRDVGSLLSAHFPHVVELDWWQSHTVGDLTITLVPAQHWSMRVPWDRNDRLWGGFVYQSPEGVAYHAGDTALSDQVFTEIARRCPRIDWAMLPIGAYEPEWFMRPQHMGPEDALAAFQLLAARKLVAMHWGTFKLTDEPLAEPPVRLRKAFIAAGLAPDRLIIQDVGETIDLV